MLPETRAWKTLLGIPVLVSLATCDEAPSTGNPHGYSFCDPDSGGGNPIFMAVHYLDPAVDPRFPNGDAFLVVTQGCNVEFADFRTPERDAVGIRTETLIPADAEALWEDLGIAELPTGRNWDRAIFPEQLDSVWAIGNTSGSMICAGNGFCQEPGWTPRMAAVESWISHLLLWYPPMSPTMPPYLWSVSPTDEAATQVMPSEVEPLLTAVVREPGSCADQFRSCTAAFDFVPSAAPVQWVGQLRWDGLAPQGRVVATASSGRTLAVQAVAVPGASDEDGVVRLGGLPVYAPCGGFVGNPHHEPTQPLPCDDPADHGTPP